MNPIAALERYRPLVDDWGAFAEVSVAPLPTSLVVNTLRTTSEEVWERLTARGVELRRVGWTEDLLISAERGQPGNRFEYLAGLYNVQEEAAAVPIFVLDPQPGERVLDMCAAPGNKTGQIALAMRNRGTVVANDRSYQRMRATRGMLDRLGLGNVCLTNFDGRKMPRAIGSFDRVLVDAPCSCEGTSRKSGAATEPVSPSEYAQLASVQRGLLKRALEMCEPGGLVVYSTCTYAPEENEMVVDAVLRDIGLEAWLEPISVPGLRTTRGVTEWGGTKLDASLEKTVRIWPHHNDCGGFYVAAIRRAPGESTLDRPDPTTAFEPTDREGWLAPLRDRFGLTFEGWRLHEPNTKDVWIVNEGMNPAPEAQRTSAGLSFLRKSMIHPKPTTGVSMLFGPEATRNVADLDRDQMNRFLRREFVELTPQQADVHDSPGYVLVRCEGLVAGVGRLGRDSRTIESFYPKAWRLGSDVSAFEEDG